MLKLKSLISDKELGCCNSEAFEKDMLFSSSHICLLRED